MQGDVPLTAGAVELDVSHSVAVKKTARVVQLSGLFDVPPTEKSSRTWKVRFTLPQTWSVGLILGPSGSGKSSVARKLWPTRMVERFDWPDDLPLVDGFPKAMETSDVCALLNAVGFSSPPAWLKPYRVLSNGEQFRVHCARALAEMKDLAVIDEFTSVVDRQVARMASAAVQKAVRRGGYRLVAVSCHDDIAEWLEPDWIYQPLTGEFLAGRSLQRPKIQLEIARVHPAGWALFREHHYLSADHHRVARCFCAFVGGAPAAWVSVIHYPSQSGGFWKAHRTVCLPDYQGVGIGMALGDFVASLFQASGKRYLDITGHPAMIQSRLRNKNWVCTRKPGLNRPNNRRARKDGTAHIAVSMRRTEATTRFTATFQYVGPARPVEALSFGIPVQGSKG